MAKTIAAQSARAAPPPFWKQLPQVFKYPANADSLIKIVCYALGAAIATNFLPFGRLLNALVWFAFVAYCFRILERTARGHLTAADFEVEQRTDRDWRPLKQVLIVIVFALLAGLVAAFVGPIAGQVVMLLASFVLPASIMVLALDEQLGAALNPSRLLATIAGIGMPYFALCAFLFLLLLSAQYLGGAFDAFLPEWMGDILGDLITMYFMVSMYYLMGYALYQNHEALGHDVHVDPAAAQQSLARGGKPAEPEVLGPETKMLIADGKLDEAATRVEAKMRSQWDDNKLHDQYLKLLALQGNAKGLAKEVNEYIPKLMREKKAARAVDVYEAGRKAVPDLLITDATLILPLAKQAVDLRREKTAFELLKGFDKRFPQSPDIPGVYFLAAKILLEKHNDFAMAQKIFAHMLGKYPQHELVPEAKRLGEIAAKMAAAPPVGAKT